MADPRQVRVFTTASLRWVIRNRAWSWYYLVRYWRYLVFRIRHRHVITTGFVFLGKNVEIHVRRGYGRMIIGAWTHIGDDMRLRCHEGSLVIGDRCVFGRDGTVNAYLDIEIGAGTIVGDWFYACDFDHAMDDINVPIKDQGLVKAPVRIGEGTWIGVRVTVLRGTRIGEHAVIGAHAVVRGQVPAYAVAGGVPARVIRDRRIAHAARAGRRASIARMGRQAQAAVGEQTAHTQADPLGDEQ